MAKQILYELAVEEEDFDVDLSSTSNTAKTGIYNPEVE